MEEAVVVLIIFGTLFAVIYVFLTTRNKERLALIEKGADAKLFKTGARNNGWTGVIVLNIALLSIGIGLGILLGSLLVETGMDEEVAMPSMIFVCGGIGLMGGFFASRKFSSNKEQAE